MSGLINFLCHCANAAAEITRQLTSRGDEPADEPG